MGLYDRDYYRDEPRGYRHWVPGRAVLGLICLLASLFLVQVLLRNAGNTGTDEVLRMGEFQLGPFLDGEVWRFITAPFLHESHDVLSLLFGLLVLYYFGHGLEEDLGGPECLSFYLAAVIFTQIVELLVRVSLDDRTTPSFGPSGPITAVVVLYALRHPREIVHMFFIPLPVWILACITVLLSLLKFTERGTALPLAGAFFAYAYFAMNVRLTAHWPQARQPARKLPKLRVLAVEDDEPEPVASLPVRRETRVDEQLEAKVDWVLEKVSKQGRESLSAEENEVLRRASEIYRKKRGD